MKKFLVSILLALFIAPQAAFAYEWQLQEFNQDIQIQNDGKIRVTETLVADFTIQKKRGPIRIIPVSYKDDLGNRFNLRFDLISVTDENGNPFNIHSQSKEGDSMVIYIGEANTFLNEVTTYKITYEIDRAIGYFDEHDELYWNVFSDWDAPVLSSTVTVRLPESTTRSDLQTRCFTGYFGSSDSDCNARVINDQTFEFDAIYTLYPSEGFTIVAGFPKGIVTKSSIIQQVLWFLGDNWAIFIPVLAALFLFFKWYTAGRDKATRDTIHPHYHPPDDLSPTEVGTLIDEKVDVHDISTVIIDYAVKGYIKIKELKTKKLLFLDNVDYELELIKSYDESPHIREHEKEILDAVFGSKSKTKISDLKYKFYKKLPNIKKKLYKLMIDKGYFAHNPENVRTIYYSIGGGIIFLTSFFGRLLFSLGGITMIISVIVTGILFLIFAPWMPRKTIKGANTYFKIKGLEEYIRTAEKDRIKFQEEKNIFFERLLPYAMVLRLGEKWAEAFKDIYKKPPDWFTAQDTTHFDSVYLLDRLSNFSTKANTAFASSPRSSGGGSSAWSGGSGFSGGFSGGGFGGGGGGSW